MFWDYKASTWPAPCYRHNKQSLVHPISVPERSFRWNLLLLHRKQKRYSVLSVTSQSCSWIIFWHIARNTSGCSGLANQLLLKSIHNVQSNFQLMLWGMQYFGDFIAHPEHEINIVNKSLVIIQLGKFKKIEDAFLSLKRKTKLDSDF